MVWFGCELLTCGLVCLFIVLFVYLFGWFVCYLFDICDYCFIVLLIVFSEVFVG